MTNEVRDEDGRKLSADVKLEPIPKFLGRSTDAQEAWGATVWFGGAYGPATVVRRYYYATRQQAEAGDISDDVGSRGRVA